VRTLLLILVLGAPPLVLQLASPVPRLDADAVEYYSHLRSLYFDGDVDFENEFDHFGILERYDKIRPTATGHRRTIFSVGPALLWLPFYALGDLWARAAGVVENGYSPAHIRSVTLASLVYGLAGLLLVYRVLVTIFARRIAFWTVFLLLYATFLYWYMVHEPVVSHAGSFFLAAAVLAVWWPGRRGLDPLRGAWLGLLIGLAATVRWQNGVLLLLPCAALLPRLRSATRPTLGRGLLVLATFVLGVLPQLLVWKAIFGSYLLGDPPHGRDFLRFSHPYVLETLFSSRHGLLFWTPVLWAGYLGVLALWRRDRGVAVAVLPPLLLMSYVNVCSGDWWAGGSFSNRRFDSVLPILALGLGQSLTVLYAWATRHPGRILALTALPLALWNFLFMEQYRRPLVPRDGTVSFSKVAGHNAGILAEWLGSPVAWPANWIFAWRHDLPPARYDLMVGKYLFYRQNNLGGVVDIGADLELDAALLGEGWSVRQPCGEVICREIQGRARLFVGLDVPETLDVTVRARGSGSLLLAVNGVQTAELPLGAELGDLRVRVPADRWRREQNELGLVTSPEAWVQVDRLSFRRLPR
jgi:hypothetical protein